jgi:hypothetical protein
VSALNKLRPLVLERVLVPHLHVPSDFGLAEFYVQKTDDADGETHEYFVEARLSRVSWNQDRANNDFRRARKALEDLYIETVHPFMEIGQRVQFNITLMLDQPLPGEKSTLIESEGDMPWVLKTQVP